VGWTLVYLDLVVGVAVWPSLPHAGRAALLTGVLALLASHWAALVVTGLGDGLPLQPLQPANRPWETWSVVPIAWALVLWAVRRTGTRQVVSAAALTGLGHMTLDAGGKDTFLRSVSSTIQSATCCSMEHPYISPSPHLCESVPAFLRTWMLKDSFPLASSVMALPHIRY